MLPCACSVRDHRGRQNVVKTSVTHSHPDVRRGSSRVPAARGAGTRDMESYLLNYRIFISIHFGTLQEERNGEGRNGKVSPQPPPILFPSFLSPTPYDFQALNLFGLRRECSGNMGKNC